MEGAEADAAFVYWTWPKVDNACKSTPRPFVGREQATVARVKPLNLLKIYYVYTRGFATKKRNLYNI